MSEPAGDHGAAGHARRTPGGQVGLAVVLTGAMTLSTVMPYALGALGPLIIPALDLSRLAFGALPTVAFTAGAAGSVLLGGLVDRSDARRVLVVLFVLGGLAHAVAAVAPSYVWLLGAMILAGGSLALANPVTNLLVARRAPPGRRGALIGVKQSGVQVGALLAGSTLPWAGLRFGWRGAMAAVAAVAFAGALAGGSVVGRTERAPASRTGRARLPRFVPWLAVYAALMGAGISTIGTYLPLYAYETLAMPVTAAGALVGVMGGFGVAGRVLWGVGAERRSSPARSLALLSVGAVLAQGLLLAAPVTGTWAAWVGAAGLGATAAAWNAVGMLAVVRDAGEETGRVSGIVQLAFYLGFVVAPLAFGWSADRTGTYAPGWTAVTVAFALAAAVALSWQRAQADRPRRPRHAGGSGP